MSKRSKLVLILIVFLILITVLTAFKEEPLSDKELEEWEEEISNPNNQLDPLNETGSNASFLVNIAYKVEGFIAKIFSFLLGIVEGFVDKIMINFVDNYYI